MAAGMSPATSLQKRQSVTLPPQNSHARYVLQVFPDMVNRPARLFRRRAHIGVLSEANFDDQAAVGRDVRRSFVEQSPHHIEAIGTGKESSVWLEARHFRLQVRRLCVAKIRRVRDDQTGGS